MHEIPPLTCTKEPAEDEDFERMLMSSISNSINTYTYVYISPLRSLVCKT